MFDYMQTMRTQCLSKFENGSYPANPATYIPTLATAQHLVTFSHAKGTHPQRRHDCTCSAI